MSTPFEQAAAAIAAGEAEGHALWIILSSEDQRGGYALQPMPWEGPGLYQHVSFKDGRAGLIMVPGTKSLPTNWGKVVPLIDEPVTGAPIPPPEDDVTCIAEAAMCLWEQALSFFTDDPAWRSYVEGNGYGQARLDMLDLVPALQEDWKQVEGRYTYSFDWDFVPQWMRDNIIIDDDGLRLREPRIVDCR